jgi:hypothetical protein
MRPLNSCGESVCVDVFVDVGVHVFGFWGLLKPEINVHVHVHVHVNVNDARSRNQLDFQPIH